MRRFRLVGLLSILVACSDGPTTDLFAIQGVVSGSVQTAAQVPVGGARVTATADYPIGNHSVSLIDSGLTNSAGEFRLLLTAGNLADTLAPLALHVTASGYASRDTSGLNVRITRFLPPADTTRVIITVAP